MSDSSYSAVTRHRQPYSTTGRPPALEIVDDDWAADTLSDDDVDVETHEAAIASFLDEGDLDVDAVVVSTGHSGPASNGNSAAERRKREEGRWVDLGLDHFDSSGVGLGGGNNGSSSSSGADNRASNGGAGGGAGSGGGGAASGAGGQSS